MTEQTQDTSSVRSFLTTAGKALGAVLGVLVVVAVVLGVLGVIVGVPAAITAYVVVTAYGMGGYLYAVGAQILMGVIWFIITTVFKVLGALATA